MRQLLSIILFFLLVIPAQAWSEGGHHLIAVMAFRKLPKEKQQELIRILKAHPRFAEDFKLPKKVRNEDEWLIGRACYWPDVACKQPEFDRPNWHNQLGSCLVLGKCEVPSCSCDCPANATMATKELHIGQVLNMCTEILHDKSKPDSERAIALCWVTHLVADAHQPCHAGSLFVEGVFPEGDRGGNEIKTKQSKNLHALWDGLLGPKWSEGALNRRADEAPKVSVAGGIETWLAESRELAVKAVYSPEVMEPMSVALRGKGEVAEVTLSEAYLKNAGSVAQKRVAEAAGRLAGVWEGIK